MSLDGVDDYASVPDNASLDLGTGATDDFTIETFFYVPDTINTTGAFLIYKPNTYGLTIIYSSSVKDRLFFRLYTDAVNYVYIYYDVDLSVGWHHVAAVFDNEYTSSTDLLALYLDGYLAKSGTGVDWTPGIRNSTSALYIGGAVGVASLTGWMEETRLSDIVRYSGDTYTVPTAAFTNDGNTRALWHFDEASGSIVFFDDSGHGNVLTGVNGAQTGIP